MAVESGLSRPVVRLPPGCCVTVPAKARGSCVWKTLQVELRPCMRFRTVWAAELESGRCPRTDVLLTVRAASMLLR